jgi:protein-disulfide isomerase
MSHQDELRDGSMSGVVARLQSWLNILVLMLMAAVLMTALVQLVRGHWIVAAPSSLVASARVMRPAQPNDVKPLPSEPLSLKGAALQGSPEAKVVIIEYSDFQCPYCGRFARDTLPKLEKDYIEQGKVQLAFREFPLESIHKSALGAAEAVECAGEQGQFWQMHNLVFADQTRLDPEAFKSRAEKSGVDLSRFDACLRSSVAERVRADERAGEALGITGTPTFFIGVRQKDGRIKVVNRLSGALAGAQFEAALDVALSNK